MSGHVEFPELSPEAKAALDRGYEANGLFVPIYGKGDRVRFAAFLQEAINQATDAHGNTWTSLLKEIAANLHSPPPPPPPPTLAQAREAARQLAGADAEIVHAFLATLEEGVQP